MPCRPSPHGLHFGASWLGMAREGTCGRSNAGVSGYLCPCGGAGHALVHFCRASRVFAQGGGRCKWDLPGLSLGRRSLICGAFMSRPPQVTAGLSGAEGGNGTSNILVPPPPRRATRGCVRLRVHAAKYHGLFFPTLEMPPPSELFPSLLSSANVYIRPFLGGL